MPNLMNISRILESKGFKNFGKQILSTLSNYWYISIFILITLILGKTAFIALAILLMLAAAVLLSLYRLIIPFNLGIELTSFFSIVLAISISPLLGTLFAVISLTISQIITKKICVFLIIKCAVFYVLCYLAPVIPLGIIGTGIIVAFLRNIIFMVLTAIMNPKRFVIDSPAAIINIVFSVWIFSKAGEILLRFFS